MNCGGVFRGRLKGKTKTKSAWTSYNVMVQDGMIKLYKGKALKGDYDLAGSSFEQSPDNALSLTLALANQQKTIITFLAGEEPEITKLIDALNCGIYHKNVSSLENGFKTPQVIEWFFQKQAEFREYESNLKIKHKFLLKKGPAHFEGSLPLVVYLSINSNLSGLAVEVEETSASTPPSLHIMHTILFREMTSVSKQLAAAPVDSSSSPDEILSTDLVIVVSPGDETTPRTSSATPFQANPFDPHAPPALQFSYVFGCFPPLPSDDAPEDFDFQNPLDSSTNSPAVLQGGIGEEEYSEEWLTGVIIAQAFCIIPSPVQNLLAPLSLHGGNSKTANGQFVTSSDIMILLRSLESYYKQIPSLPSFATEIQHIFQTLSQVQCNRDAACCFGHRLEEIIRILANPRQGILRVALVSYYSTLQSQILTLTQKLIEIKAFLSSLTVSGWLSLTLYGQLHHQRSRFNRLLSSESTDDLPYLRMKYEECDRDLMVIMNRIIRDFPQMNWNEFETSFGYDMVLDVMETVENYGGVKKIKSDRSKIKAVSRLIQCNEVELEVELRRMAPSMKRKLCRNLFCCCFQSDQTSPQHKRESYDDPDGRGNSHSAAQRKSQSKRTVSADLSEGLLSETSSYGAKAGDVDFFQPSLREEQHMQHLLQQRDENEERKES